MSTNATINVKTAGGRYQQTYVHWDGDPAYTGKRLVENFNTQELAEAISNLGDLSSVGTCIGEKHNFNTHGSPETRHMCCAYGRDRGETGTHPNVFDTFNELVAEGDSQEYNYFFIDGEWYLNPGYSIKKGNLVKLSGEEVNV